MKIAFYNHTSVVSGAEISLLLTAKHLTRARPLLFAPDGELLERALQSGLEAVPIPSYRATLTKNPFRMAKDMLGILWAGFQLALTIRKHQIDLIHANSLRAGIIAALFTWLHRCPVVWHVRDIPPKGIMGWGINRLAQGKVKALISISDAVMNGFDNNKIGGKLHLVHNGVEFRETNEHEKEHCKATIRQQLNTPSSGKVMAIIGQITPWKRQEDAIRAAQGLLLQGHDVYLWVVGEAKFREENIVYRDSIIHLSTELGIEERVRFTGFRNDIREICCAADLLLLCSDNEPFGRVIIEAMSQSLPVVATNGGGVPEIITHEQCGLLYEVGNVHELVQNVSRLLRDEQLIKQLTLNAEQRVRRQFTIQTTAEKIEEIYGEII